MNVRKEIYKMAKKSLIFPIMLMMMVLGCADSSTNSTDNTAPDSPWVMTTKNHIY